jgi:arabinofuranan 3-O-arabinosyltransferase
VALFEARTSWPTGPDLYDFGAFLGVGQALRAGINPYGALPLTPTTLVDGRLVPWPNANPPTLLPLFAAVAGLDPLGAMRVWFVISLGLYAILLAALLRAYPAKRTLLGLAWLVALMPLWENESRGQIYVPLAIATTGAWLALRERRPVMAGILMGLVTALKPNFALWPAALYLAGYVAPALVAAVVAAGLFAIPFFLYGPTIYLEWLGSITTDHGVDLRNVGSVFSVGALLGARPWSLLIGVVLAAMLVAGLAVWAARARPNPHDVTARAVVIALLAGPITWHGYVLLALPIFLSRRWSNGSILAAILTMFPPSILPALAVLGLDVVNNPPTLPVGSPPPARPGEALGVGGAQRHRPQ